MSTPRPTSLIRRLRGPLLTAMLLAFGFLFGIGYWSANAPLTSAAVAPGSVGLEARRKTVQHLEGGILAEIRVAEGDHVDAGDLLIVLDDTIETSTLDLLRGQYVDMLALRARLVAERDGMDHLTVPQQFEGREDDPRVAQAMAAQTALFQSRRAAYDSRVGLLNSKILKLDQQITGLDAQETALLRQQVLIGKEVAEAEALVAQGLERAPRLYGLQREAARIDGVLGELAAARSEATVLIDETRLGLLDLEARVQNQVAGELSDLTGRIADMVPRLNAARDKLARTRIRAPVGGRVVSLTQNTRGGVLSPGQPILDIIPDDLELLIEARVRPTEIDVVRPGLTAEVRLTAFSARSTPTLPGEVIHVSADRLTDAASGQPYYAVHVRLSEGAAARVPDIDLTELYPGMPVEVMVVTGQQTVLDYFLQPISDVMARALREG